jgi:hypothetical protein
MLISTEEALSTSLNELYHEDVRNADFSVPMLLIYGTNATMLRHRKRTTEYQTVFVFDEFTATL